MRRGYHMNIPSSVYTSPLHPFKPLAFLFTLSLSHSHAPHRSAHMSLLHHTSSTSSCDHVHVSCPLYISCGCLSSIHFHIIVSPLHHCSNACLLPPLCVSWPSTWCFWFWYFQVHAIPCASVNIISSFPLPYSFIRGPPPSHIYGHDHIGIPSDCFSPWVYTMLPSPRASSMSLYSPIHDILTTTSNYTSLSMTNIHIERSIRLLHLYDQWLVLFDTLTNHCHWYPLLHFMYTLSPSLLSCETLTSWILQTTLSQSQYLISFLPPSISASPPPYRYMIFTSHPPPLSIIHRYSPASMVCYDQHDRPTPIR